MAYANLNRVSQTIDGFDSIIIVKDLSDIPAGVTLDTTGWAEDSIKAGTPIVKKGSTYKPLAVSEGAFAALSSDEEYFGILKSSILKAVPMAAVLRAGVVNAAAAKTYLGAEYPTALKTALKNIDFIY